MAKQQSGMSGLLEDEDEGKKTSTPPSPPDPPDDPEDDKEELPPPPLATVKTTKVPDRRGEKIRTREQLVQSLGISRKYCPPITRRRMVKYRLINAGKIEDPRLTGLDRKIEPPYFGFSPHYTFRDMEDPNLSNREKTITYWAGGSEVTFVEDPISKKKVRHLEPKVGSPEMLFGEVMVNTLAEYNRYVWWELHPQNRSNKWAPQNGLKIFERVDSEFRSAHLENIRIDMYRTADDYVRKMKPNQLINLASALNNPTMTTDIDSQELLFRLRQRARQNPEEILFTKPDEIGSVKVMAIHALDTGIIEFESDRESYYYAEDEDPMLVIPINNDPFESLVNFLHDTPEGQKYFSKIKTDLEFWF